MNPRELSPCLFSRQVPSTTRPFLQNVLQDTTTSPRPWAPYEKRNTGGRRRRTWRQTCDQYIYRLYPRFSALVVSRIAPCTTKTPHHCRVFVEVSPVRGKRRFRRGRREKNRRGRGCRVRRRALAGYAFMRESEAESSKGRVTCPRRHFRRRSCRTPCTCRRSDPSGKWGTERRSDRPAEHRRHRGP